MAPPNPNVPGLFTVSHVPYEPFWQGGEIVTSEVWRRWFDNLFAKVGGSSSVIINTNNIIAGLGIAITVDSTANTVTITNTGVREVNANGGNTGLTITGGPITTTGTFTLGGTLEVGSGGTGAATASVALNNLLPNQAGSAGSVLETDGTNAFWSAFGSLDEVTAWGVAQL